MWGTKTQRMAHKETPCLHLPIPLAGICSELEWSFPWGERVSWRPPAAPITTVDICNLCYQRTLQSSQVMNPVRELPGGHMAVLLQKKNPHSVPPPPHNPVAQDALHNTILKLEPLLECILLWGKSSHCIPSSLRLCHHCTIFTYTEAEHSLAKPLKLAPCWSKAP